MHENHVLFLPVNILSVACQLSWPHDTPGAYLAQTWCPGKPITCTASQVNNLCGFIPTFIKLLLLSVWHDNWLVTVGNSICMHIK